jgi:hypothetical protein
MLRLSGFDKALAGGKSNSYTIRTQMLADNQDREFKHKELTAKIIEFFYNKTDLVTGFSKILKYVSYLILVLNRKLPERHLIIAEKRT